MIYHTNTAGAFLCGKIFVFVDLGMKMKTMWGILAAGLLVGSVQAKETEDPFIWLEAVDGEKAMDWVLSNNKDTADQYKAKPIYDELYQEALTALNGKSRIPSISQRGDWVYNYWRDENNPRGVYRRAKLKDFQNNKPKWQTVLDMDQYNKDNEGKWVFKGMSCLSPQYRHCLTYLSPGGGDSVVMKEFDMKKQSFIKDGFSLPNSKMRVTWRDKDHLFVGTDFGEGSMTTSGYPRMIKLWKRGDDLNQAKLLKAADPEMVSIFAYRDGEGKDAKDFIIEGPSFWTSIYYQWVDGEAKKLALPETAVVNGHFDGRMIVSLKADWQFDGQFLSEGDVLLMKPEILTGEKQVIEAGDWEVFLQPKANQNVESISTTEDTIIVTLLEDVVGRVQVYQQNDDGSWDKKTVAFPDNGAIGLMSVDSESGSFFAQYESFLTPPTLYFVDGEKLQPESVMSQNASFDAAPYKVEQFFARSKDGTFVPYFTIMNKDTVYNGKNPTHIFSYGGFRNSLTPSYSGSYEALEGAYGKMWLDRGGVYVSANIRGGGAYGPKWHKAALLENRHKAFEDFEAVAEDLIKRNITSPNHLGIEGRSNGGLLVGATMTRRPDLYGAVICGVPLLDMKRYNKLLAGASWMGEYGNPDIPEQWAFLKTYSPYQNLKKDTDYPATFFYTSTRDDRVHPGHARKMAAKMKSYGYPIWYYENIEGGHGGSSTNEQLAERLALAFTHLWTHLK